jgi:regulator of sigma E protease
VSNIIAAVIAFSVMVVVHELGHFLVAKRVGVTVYAFAVGFGPRLAGFTRGETTYAINALPFGGYVRMAGEDMDDSGGEGSFRAKSVWQRMAVVAAGPVMNIALAFVLYIAMALAVGVFVGPTNRIGELMAGWPAEQAGLRPGDAIVAIDGVPMESGEQVIDTIHKRPNEVLRLTVARGTEHFEVNVRSRFDPRQKIGLIGFRPEAIRERMGPVRAVAWSAGTIGATVSLIFSTLVGLIRNGGAVLDQLAGPVGAVKFLGEAGAAGAEIFIYTAAGLSIMIGVFNLLPLPALDGGRIFFLALEAIRRRALDAKREGYVHLVGFVLLIALLVILTVRDLGRL